VHVPEGRASITACLVLPRSDPATESR